MTKKELVIIAFLLFTGCSIWAQRDYRKGYIITNEQDTIYGWIDYRGDVRNAKICSFKETETGQATEYTPSDIEAYRYTDGKFYISKDIGSADTPDQVFLEYLVNGLAKLYYYRDKDERYYIEKEGHLFELKSDEREVVIDGRTQVRTVKSYIGQLKATLNVWEMNSEIDKAKLEHASLINIARDYHQYACTDGSECIVYEKKKSPMVLRIGPVIGYDLSTVIFWRPKGYAGYWKYDFAPSSNFTVGMNINLSMPRLNEKISLQLQAMYTKNSFLYTYEFPGLLVEIDLRSKILQTGLAIKYEYPKGKWRPTLAAGLATIYLPDDKSLEEKTYSIINGEQVLYENKNEDFPTKFMYGFGILPGVHYYIAKRQIIFLQLQYQQYYKRESVDYPSNKIRSLGLSAGIYF